METNKLWQHSIMLICLMIGGLFVSCDDDGIEKIAPPETPMTKPLYDSKWESAGVSGTYRIAYFNAEGSYSKTCSFFFYPKGTSYSYDWRDYYYYERSGNMITFTTYSSSDDYEPCLTRAVLSDDNMTMALYGKEANYSWYEEKLLMTLSRE